MFMLQFIIFQQLKEIKIKPKKGEELSKRQSMLQKTIWLTSVGRNAAVVIICTIVAYVLDFHGSTVLKLTGNFNFHFNYSENPGSSKSCTEWRTIDTCDTLSEQPHIIEFYNLRVQCPMFLQLFCQ